MPDPNTLPDPATLIKQEMPGSQADTVPVHFASPVPVTRPARPRHFEAGTPPEKKPKLPAPNLAWFGKPLTPPLYAGVPQGGEA